MAHLTPFDGEGDALEDRALAVVAEVDVLQLQEEAPAGCRGRAIARRPFVHSIAVSWKSTRGLFRE